MTEAPLLVVDPGSSVPPYEQVRSQLASAIASGALAPETRLPPIRTVAADLGLAVNTVARSYRELEAAGVVETRGRNGTFVVGAPTEARRRAGELTRDFVAEMRGLGLAPAEIQAMLRRELPNLTPGVREQSHTGRRRGRRHRIRGDRPCTSA